MARKAEDRIAELTTRLEELSIPTPSINPSELSHQLDDIRSQESQSIDSTLHYYIADYLRNLTHTEKIIKSREDGQDMPIIQDRVEDDGKQEEKEEILNEDKDVEDIENDKGSEKADKE